MAAILNLPLLDSKMDLMVFNMGITGFPDLKNIYLDTKIIVIGTFKA